MKGLLHSSCYFITLMKITFTAFILLLIFIRSTAATVQSDTSIKKAAHNSRSALTPTTVLQNSYGITLTISERQADSVKLFASSAHYNGLRHKVLPRLEDSLILPLASYHVYNFKQPFNTHRRNYTLGDSLKGYLYTVLATKYLDYDTISGKKRRSYYQGEALKFTMMALHQYSSFNDTTGLRICFDGLAKIYISQKKYTQAKWFILQSNAISRGQNDLPNLISSLITLSIIKGSIKDYKLAMQDLNEALELSQTRHLPKKESEVFRNYAMLYSRMKDYPKEAMMLKKRDSVEDSMRKKEEAALTAKLAAQAATQRKSLDSLQVKKKANSPNTRKSSKNSSAKKIVSL